MYNIERFRNEDIFVVFENLDEANIFIDECAEYNIRNTFTIRALLESIVNNKLALVCGYSINNGITYGTPFIYIKDRWTRVNAKDLIIMDVPSKESLIEFLDI